MDQQAAQAPQFEAGQRKFDEMDVPYVTGGLKTLATEEPIVFSSYVLKFQRLRMLLHTGAPVAKICEEWAQSFQYVVAEYKGKTVNSDRWREIQETLDHAVRLADSLIAIPSTINSAVTTEPGKLGARKFGQGVDSAVTTDAGAQKKQKRESGKTKARDFKLRRDQFEKWAVEKLVKIIAEAASSGVTAKTPTAKEFEQMYIEDCPSDAEKGPVINYTTNKLAPADMRAHPEAPAILGLSVLRSMADTLYQQRRSQSVADGADSASSTDSADVGHNSGAEGAGGSRAIDSASPNLGTTKPAGTSSRHGELPSSTATPALAPASAPSPSPRTECGEKGSGRDQSAIDSSSVAYGIHCGPEPSQGGDGDEGSDQFEKGDDVVVLVGEVVSCDEGVATARACDANGSRRTAHTAVGGAASSAAAAAALEDTSAVAAAGEKGGVATAAAAAAVQPAVRERRRQTRKGILKTPQLGSMGGDERQSENADDNVPIASLQRRTTNAQTSAGSQLAAVATAVAAPKSAPKSAQTSAGSQLAAVATAVAAPKFAFAMPVASFSFARGSSMNLNDLATGNCPTGGPNQGAGVDDAISLAAVEARFDTQRGLMPRLMVTLTVCRAIWRTGLIGTESALYCGNLESTNPETSSKLDTLIVAAVFPPSVLQLLAVADDGASGIAVPGEMQYLENVLADSTTSEHKLIELHIFREKALAFLARVAVAAGRDSDPGLSLYQAKANIMHTRIEEEFARRTPSHCAGCWKAGPVFVCGCGEGYCHACGTCNGSGAVQPGSEFFCIVCHVCRLEADIRSADLQAECPDVISTQAAMVRAVPGPSSRCLSCGRVVATRRCSSCSTSFCAQCAVNWPPGQESNLWCRSCMGEEKFLKQCTGREASLARLAIPNQAVSRPKGAAQFPKCSSAVVCDSRPYAVELAELCMDIRACGLHVEADRMLPKIFNATHVQLAAGAASPFAPQQIIRSLGRHSSVNVTLLRAVLAARDVQTKAEASNSDTTWDRVSESVEGKIRLGYWITAAAWSPPMFEGLVPWLKQMDSKHFLVTLIFLGGEEIRLQALEAMLQFGDALTVSGGSHPVAAASPRVLRISDKLSDQQAYRMVRPHNLDISVDLDCGGGARPALIRMKGLASTIVNAVGMPCPQPKKKNGDREFLLSDDRALPQEMKRAWQCGVEPVLKVGVSRPFAISRALTAMQNNRSTRANFQLPPDGFIFVHIEEVSPASPNEMQLMLNIVHGTPGSCLVMMGQTTWTKASLRGEARSFASNLAPTAQARFDPEKRVLFRPWPQGTDDRIKLMSHGDLLLVGHEGGSVTGAGLLALAAGLPALVCVSDSGAGSGSGKCGGFAVLRDISSALWYMGLGEELVVKCEITFVEKAQELGNHQAKILYMKAHLRAHIADKTALFSERRQVLEWENGLKKLHQIASGDSISDSIKDDDIDASLEDFGPCVPLQFPWQNPETGQLQKQKACSEPEDRALKAAMQRESMVRKMAEAFTEFRSAESKAQLDSLFEDAQANGVELRKLTRGGGYSSVVLGDVMDPSILSTGVTGVALIIERRKAPAARLFNRSLCRYYLTITSNRTRQPHDEFVVRPVRLFEKGTSCLSISFPDAQGECIVCLVVEELAQGYQEGLQSDLDNWTRDLRLTEGLRCDFQELLHALSMIHRASIVHGDVKPANIMRNRNNGLVFVDCGSSWRFKCNGRANKLPLLQRRATSMAVSIDLKTPGKQKRSVGRQAPNSRPVKKGKAADSAKEQAVRAGLPKQRNRTGCSTALPARKGGNCSATSSSLSNGRQPMHLTDHAMTGIMERMATAGLGLATVGPATALFRRRAQPQHGNALIKEEGEKDDIFAVFRSFMILLRPIGDGESPSQWDGKAQKAAESKQEMQRFLQSDRQCDSGRVAARMADFIWKGITEMNLNNSQTHEFVTLPIYPEEIERSIFQGNGFLVKGGSMSTVPGCPLPFQNAMLKDVLVITEPGINGAGLKSLSSYKLKDIVCYYLGISKNDYEITNGPPGRYIVAVTPKGDHANGEFTKERTLEWYAQRKAVGVCINAPQRGYKRNCLLLRGKAVRDAEGNTWIPVSAARDIVEGEFFCFKYNHEEGANGYNFREK